MRRVSAVSFGVLLIACSLHSSHAFAQQPAATATAEVLFAEGRRLVGEGKLAEACPKFEAAQRIAPSPGTLLNLADCYEKAGRLASAWASFREAVAASRAAGRADLVAQAQRRSAALEPRLSKLSITVSATAAGLEVLRDGTPVPREAWGTPVPVDAGEHVVEARAPGRRPLRLPVAAPAEGATATANVPELEVEPAPVAPPPAAPVPPAPSASPAASPSPPPTSAAEPAAGASSDQKTLALIFGGVGVVGLGIGGVLALGAKSKYDDSLPECPRDPNLCTEAGKSMRDDARSQGNIATVVTIVGGLAAAGGLVLWLTAPSAPRGVALSVGPTQATVVGRFQ